jgi:hypothetical protein
MSIDVIDLRDFYSKRLGIVARQLINRGIRARWPNADGQRVLGIGYPTPYLGLFREDAERCIAFMPAAQGVLKWPTARPTLAALIDEFSMPLPDAAVDRVLLVHALEMSDDPEGLLREVWRVLALPVAGVHIVEATKQVYRAIPAKRERTRLIPALEPVLVPSSTATRG